MTDWLQALLLGPGWGLVSQLLPCPLNAGWSVEQDLALPGPGGGYSAIQMEPGRQRFWLLSDLPEGELSAWTLPSDGRHPDRVRSLQLQVPPSVTQQLDGEGLVIEGDQAWIATEGRRSRERAPQLLRVSLSNGELQAAVALPPAWQQGLASNAGPESLARLSRSNAPLALLMAAERPLLHDPADQVRLLRWAWPAGRDPRRDPPQAHEQGALAAPAGGQWGLTDLLVLHPPKPHPPLLLTLWRHYADPLQWSNQLRLYRLPAPQHLEQPLQQWDLQASGLTPENWEGLSLGPTLSPGQPSLLLVSDDNRNPFQTSRLARLSPRHSSHCTPELPGSSR
ncbi:esterase-like activity of phytase family protein [Synechococcus sp. HK05]|uniref:esterase-like activity of phytase family protein n=1 Tax=Synechococcus sp. HK05 TaxID=2725975 RepID=UPI001C38656B|nr:esterase-like activity of phytase family protein [Synechococcus sp. HK05]MBV2351153.1 esterase-like activity of phytase family protein [Synechococcus sp. HK05]